ncbi:MAG: nucleotidyltransferase domain-containing protein [Thermodesulfobacteriota bacterium]|nr:nucleotidyltransferase domain-containing protein [Thermodesulfobacteriota bacterium]
MKRLSGSVRIFYPEFDKEKLIQILKGKLKDLEAKLPLNRVILFGSYSKDRYTVGSDIDLLVVYSGKVREDAYAIVKKTINIPRLEPHLFTYEEYQILQPTLDKMTEKGVVLFSKEEPIQS